jgi:MFS transporter, DHA3 family, tetracycline resistance protein
MLLTLLITEVIRRRLHTRKQGNEQSALIRAMFLCYILLIVGTAVFALTGNFYLAIVAYWLARIGRRADMPLYNAWITRNSEPRTRATVFSMFGQVDAVGQTLSGSVIGYIGTIASLRTALATASIVLGPCVIFFLKALKLSKYVPTYSEEQSGADNPGEEGKEDILNTPIA